MRRLIAIVALAVAVPVVAIFGMGAGLGGGDGYEIRAIFDNASAVAPGGDVKIAGARVGTVGSMDVAPGKKAALVLKINDSRFTPFHSNARCTIVLATFIGEKSVECQPGTVRAPAIPRVKSGAGEGQHLLPVTHTSSPVDLDIVNNTLRLPFRQRLTLIINELGTGLAGRGRELNAVIHRANPAFRETDKILATLARQNRVLARLAQDSDTVLAPLAREKAHVADFIQQGNTTASAAAQETAATEASIQRLPGFLRQLRPLLADLGGFADQASPVLHDLGLAAPATNRVTELLGPFSAAALPAVQSLGRAASVGTPAVVAARPLSRNLRNFASNAVPVSTNLQALTGSLDRTGGLKRILDYVFYQTLAINGFDSLGHYLRTELIAKLACGIYATTPAPDCNANFTSPPATAAASKDSLASLIASSRASQPQAARSSPPTSGGRNDAPSPSPAPSGPRRAPSLSPKVERGSREPMLDYLLGGNQ
jgi:ABC-type transporter Mla subunit MlaD